MKRIKEPREPTIKEPRDMSPPQLFPLRETITISLDLAVLIRNEFLPTNPRKLRAASMEVINGAHEFIRTVRDAQYCSKKERWVK